MRDYRQNCGVARASDLLGERWTLLIVRDLLIAPRRFSELERRLKGMGTNLLAKRLKDLQAAGIIRQEEGETPHYVLTQMGQSLEPLVLELARWGMRWAGSSRKPGGLHFPDWDLLALKALFVPNIGQKHPIIAAFADGEWAAWVRIDSNAFGFGLGPSPAMPDIAFDCPISALRYQSAVVASLRPAQRKIASRFLDCFPISSNSPR